MIRMRIQDSTKLLASHPFFQNRMMMNLIWMMMNSDLYSSLSDLDDDFQ